MTPLEQKMYKALDNVLDWTIGSRQGLPMALENEISILMTDYERQLELEQPKAQY